MSARIGIDHLTMTGVSPVPFIKTAAAAGAGAVALWPQTGGFNPYGLPEYSLITDAQLRRDTRACLADHDVSLELIDALVIRPERTVEDMRPIIEACVEVGARRFNAVSFEPVWERTVDQMAVLAEIASEFNSTIVLEFCPLLPIASLALALEIIDRVAAPNLKLLIDTMHIVRSGEVGALSRVDRDLIEYIQISDGPLVATSAEAYGREATLERALPGDGFMPLVEIVAHAPLHTIVSSEVPMHGARMAGVSDLDRSKQVVASIQRILDGVAQLG